MHTGYLPSRLADPEDVRKLIQQLRPANPGIDLVRIGAEGDGGYLVPDDLSGIGTCFSPGVGSVSAFEDALAARGMRALLADGSVDRPPMVGPRVEFQKRFLASVDDSGKGLMTLDSWVETAGEAASNGDLLLQMDIEGSEYEVIHSLSTNLLKRFRIIVVEFHELDRLIRSDCLRWMGGALTKLLRFHRVVHIHPNNCSTAVRYGPVEIPCIMEFTFLRSDRFVTQGRYKSFPNPLDRPNLENRPDLALPASWW